MKVSDPQGRTWRVNRRWLPWRLRLRDVTDWSSPDLSLGDDLVGGLIALVVFVVVVPIIVLVIVVALEFALLLLLLPVFLLLRVAFGRHWVVTVRRGRRLQWEAPSGDWAASRERIVAIARDVEAGRALPA